VTTWALLAPGPSASADDAARVADAGIPIGAIGNAFQLVESPAFIAATDSAWWRKYPEAKERSRKLFTMHNVSGVERVRVPGWAAVNSGVLGLQCAKLQGATRILLLGFDMRGTHFFGPYTNGLINTTEARRRQHLKQYAAWRLANPGVEVINCTPGSALQCFPAARLDDYLRA
jgi:hypothetical protein